MLAGAEPIARASMSDMLGEWGVRQTIAAGIETFRLPLRLSARFRVNLMGGDAAIVESYISYLRKKVDGVVVEDENGEKHKVTPLIETKRGIGYMIRAPKTAKKDA